MTSCRIWSDSLNESRSDFEELYCPNRSYSDECGNPADTGRLRQNILNLY